MVDYKRIDNQMIDYIMADNQMVDCKMNEYKIESQNDHKMITRERIPVG
jgi:hypothetical protein